MEADESRSTGTAPAADRLRSNVVKVLNWGDNPPIVVCLCGPEKFQSDMLSAFRAFTLAGHIVVMPGMFTNANGGFINDETRKKLNDLHLRKIEMADIVYIVNPRGQINATTQREIEYAESLGKQIRYLDS